MSRKKRARRREVGAQLELREPVARALIERWHRWLVPALIALVTFAAFLPTLQNQFMWDDEKNLLTNYHYRGLGWAHLRWMWTAFHMGHYTPLTWMTFGGDHLLWGMKAFGYHLSSLLLHAANAVVFYFVVLRILRLARPAAVERGHAGLTGSAASAALLFALHPLRVESVAWATERRDVLSGLFYVLTILVYLRACEGEELGRRWYWVAVALFGCALLSKSMAVSLPVVLLILDVYPLQRLGGATKWWSVRARGVYLEKIPFVLLAVAASAIAFLALFRLNNMAPLDQLRVPQRLAMSAYSLSFYLWKTVVPVNLSPLYEPHELDPWATPFLLSYGAVLAITAVVTTLRRRAPGLAAVWLAYVVILLPVLGIFQNGPQIAADRYTYLAGLGWAALAGAGLLSSRRWLSFLFSGLVACIVLGLGTLTWSQVQVWHDPENLWAHTLSIDPESSIAHNNLGNALENQGKLAEAGQHYRQALHYKPDYVLAHYNLGNMLARQGKLAEASERYRQALHFKPDYAPAHNNLGSALTQQGNLAEAIEHYRQALDITPGDADTHYNLGSALTQQGNLAEAIEHYRQALDITPGDADAHNHWGLALARQGKLAEAIEHYQQAVELRPSFTEAQSNLVDALRRLGMGQADTASSQKNKKVE